MSMPALTSFQTEPIEAGPHLHTIHIEGVPLARPTDTRLPLHAFTIDVEDWYQSCIDYDAPITERVVRNVDRLLAVLDDCGTYGTFFVQGRVAETFPGLVESLVAQGHEVQSHGYSHKPLHKMSRAELREELERGKATVEDAAGMAVTMFRAGDFAINASNLWAFETLGEVGFEIDSSIFPMQGRHYGISDWPLDPHTIVTGDGHRILEVPVAVWPVGGARVPVSGGGYFRLLPTWVIARGIRSIAAASRPAVVYCHPYEFNTDELGEHGDVAMRHRLAQGVGRGFFPGRIRKLLTAFPFGSVSDVLRAWGALRDDAAISRPHDLDIGAEV
jgi:polysaccharide deacetylase family protein (PEP-CTERM system associated)